MVQKKSLISNLSATKKAVVASQAGKASISQPASLSKGFSLSKHMNVSKGTIVAKTVPTLSKKFSKVIY